MNQGTIRVSARKIASVLMGGNCLVGDAERGRRRACVCTAAVASGRARYDCQCIWNSTDGFPSPAAIARPR